MKFARFVFAFLLLVLAGCSEFPSLGMGSPTGTAPQETFTSPPTEEQIPETPPGTPTAPGPVTLRLWLPPQFDPGADTEAGKLFAERLEEFTRRRPGVRVEVRIKAVHGPGGLLDSLTTTSAAAPLALPDLIALPHPLLETAALKGLLYPMDGLTLALDNPDWYEYARQLARLQTSTFGLPLAGDAMILVYRPAVVSPPPEDWPTAISTAQPLAFPAADTQSLFTLALYQSAGGAIRDDQGRPFLNVTTLATVLSFYGEAEKANVMPYWLTQYQSDDQVWEAFQENRTDMVVTWTSRYLQDLRADATAAPLPTQDGTPMTLASGWVLALANPNPTHQELGAELAEFLTESSFIGEWTEAAGYLPPRPSALRNWTDASLFSLMDPVALSARLYPSADILTSLGPAIQQATVEVLKQQSDPLAAAQEAADGLSGP